MNFQFRLQEQRDLGINLDMSECVRVSVCVCLYVCMFVCAVVCVTVCQYVCASLRVCLCLY